MKGKCTVNVYRFQWALTRRGENNLLLAISSINHVIHHSHEVPIASELKSDVGICHRNTEKLGKWKVCLIFNSATLGISWFETTLMYYQFHKPFSFPDPKTNIIHFIAHS